MVAVAPRPRAKASLRWRYGSRLGQDHQKNFTLFRLVWLGSTLSKAATRSKAKGPRRVFVTHLPVELISHAPGQFFDSADAGLHQVIFVSV
jgi:hypothetical protein